jgi:hypothetical protein
VNPAQRGGGVRTFGSEERAELGKHGRAGGGEEPFAQLQQLGGQGSAGRGGQPAGRGVIGAGHLMPPYRQVEYS